MAVRMGDLVFDAWQALPLPGGWSDTFVFPVSARAGLPPKDYSALIRRLAVQLHRVRRSASLWVPVAAPGRWFGAELRARVRGVPVPVALTQGHTPPDIRAFSFFPWTDRQPSPPPPPTSPLLQTDLSPACLACLRVLARVRRGYTPEVASLAGISVPHAREALHTLTAQALVSYLPAGDKAFPYPSWQVTRAGLSLTLRSWGVPPGVPFVGWQARRVARARGRGVARLWPAWVQRAWPDAEVWTGWSEVNLGNPYPDALSWGRVHGEECLIWLEAERALHFWEPNLADLGHQLVNRFHRALVYTRRFATRTTRLPLVFAVLGPERVQQSARKVFHALQSLPHDAAVIMADWKAFGHLPQPVWGQPTWH